MRRHVTSTITVSIACGALILGSLSGCIQNEEPPPLPPVGSMAANLEATEQAPDAAKNADPATVGDYQNFANAWVRVKILQLYGAGIVLIPSIVIGAALTQEPVQQGDAWIWSVTALGATADLEVRASLVSGWDVDLYVTNDQLERFHWIEGNFELDLTQGTWRANDPELPAGDDTVLEISWTYTSETDRSLAFANVNQTSPDVGDVLTYSISGDTASLVFDDASDPDLEATISWNMTTGAGDIQVPLYNTGERACWDATFMNAPCE